MSKPFTIIAAFLFLIGGSIHAYRVYTGFSVVLAGHVVPLWVSWIGVVLAAVLASMLLVESQR